MIIFGLDFISEDRFFVVNSIDEIRQTPSNSKLLIKFEFENIELMKYCKKNNLIFATLVTDVISAIYSENLGSSFVISDKNVSPLIQKVCDDYLYDLKNLLLVENENDILWAVEQKIDGVIFKGAINGTI